MGYVAGASVGVSVCFDSTLFAASAAVTCKGTPFIFMLQMKKPRLRTRTQSQGKPRSLDDLRAH